MIGVRARLGMALIGLAGAGVAGATTSSAAVGPECVGDTHAAFCVTVDPTGLPTVDPMGGAGIHDCVFVGPPPCTPIDIPTPSVAPGTGPDVLVVTCGGSSTLCESMNPIVVTLPPPLAAR